MVDFVKSFQIAKNSFLYLEKTKNHIKALYGQSKEKNEQIFFISVYFYSTSGNNSSGLNDSSSMISEPLSWISHRCLHNAGIYKHQVIRAIFYFNFYLWLYIIDKYRHSANSSHETSNPRGSGVHTVRTLQGLQGFVLNFDFGMYLNQIFSRHFAGVQINTK